MYITERFANLKYFEVISNVLGKNMRASKPRFQSKYISIFAPKINIISAIILKLQIHIWKIIVNMAHANGTFICFIGIIQTLSVGRSRVRKHRSVFCLLYKFTKSDGVEGIPFFHLHPKRRLKKILLPDPHFLIYIFGKIYFYKYISLFKR